MTEHLADAIIWAGAFIGIGFSAGNYSLAPFGIFLLALLLTLH